MAIFGRLGYLIGAHPFILFNTTICFSLPILSFFILKPIIIITDIRRGFANEKGSSVQEFQRFAQFYNTSWRDFEILAVLIESKNKSGLPLRLTPQLCDEIERLDHFVKTLSINDKSDEIRYSEFETVRGSVNYFFHAFKWAYDFLHLFEGVNSNESSIILSYPHATIYGHTVPLASHFFGPTLIDNFQEKGFLTAMDSVSSAALFYLTTSHGHQQALRLQRWEQQLLRQSQYSNFSELFDFYIYGDQIANAEVERGNEGTVKAFIFGVIFMIAYMAYTLKHFPLKSRIFLVITSVGSPLLSTLLSFATLGWLGIIFNPVMSLTPILVLGIGVDDAFLLVHCWRHINDIKEPSRRMSKVVREVGPSITITSVTNVLAFGVGIISPSPIMSKFCVTTALAVAFDYILELTLFAPSMAMSYQWEGDCKPTLMKKIKKSSKWKTYAKLITSNHGRIFVITTFVVLFVFSGYGIAKMKVTFDPSKTFPSDSPLIDSLRIADDIYKQYAPLNFVVNKPPNISDYNEYTEFSKMVDDLESIPESYGSDRTLFWLRDYEKYYEKTTPDHKSVNISYNKVPAFLSDKLMADKNVVRYHFDENGEVIVDSFVFAIICRGKDGWNPRAHLAGRIRNLLKKYPQFDVSLFDYDSTVFDLITTVKDEMLKAVLITLACMTFVCFIFIPKLIAILFAISTILSISYNLLGILSWWGLDIDPVTMVDFLMAIGFSVDFSAHICYHFYHYESSQHVIKGVASKMAYIFTTIGTPTIEAGISTIICMLPMFAIQVYVVASFAKTVITVTLLGMYHGLIVLPSILTIEIKLPRKKFSTNDSSKNVVKDVTKWDDVAELMI